MMSKVALEELNHDIDKLREFSLEMPIIVEGRRDERALRDIGIKGEILKISNGMSLFEFCEAISERYEEVILMTDLDKEGNKLTKNLRNYLIYKGVKINEKFKLIMRKLRTNEVENLHARMKKVKTF